MFDVLLRVFDTVYLSIATYGVALAFVLLAMLAPSRSALLRPSERAVSPLWLLVPAIVAAGLLSFKRYEPLALTVGGNTYPVLFVVQVVVSVWVLWRNRSFPWLVVPAALVLGWIQWSFFLAAQVAGAGSGAP
jgi:hypothetical protein